MAGESSVEDIIGTALQDAGMAETNDFGELVPTDEPAVEEAAPADTEGEQTTEEGEKKPEAKVETDPTDLELESLGIRGKDDRGQETRIRYSRIRKIWDNYKKKFQTELETGHQKLLKERDDRIAQMTPRLQHMDRIEAAIRDNPTRYFEALAAASPAIRKLLEKPIFAAAAAEAVKDAQGGDDPMPRPNSKFPDGSPGYDEEGLQKLRLWEQRQVRAAVMKEVEEKYGKPVERMNQREREAVVRDESAKRVQKNVETARRIYGKVFDDDFGQIGNINAKSEIMRVLSNGQGHTFLEACGIALMPLIQTDRNRMREDLVKELEGAKSAARSSSPESSSASAVPTPKTPEDIIVAEMRRAKMIP